METNQHDDLLRNTIDSAMDLIQVFKAVRNEDNQIIDFVWILNNKAAEKYYGDVIGKSLLSLNPGVIEEGIFETFKKVVNTGEPDQSIRHYVHEQFDGWFLQSAVRQGDGVATTTKDITEIKKANEAEKESRKLLQEIIDAPGVGITVYKVVRNSEGEIVDFLHEYVSRGSKAMLGEDWTGRLFSEHGENARSQLPQLIEVIEKGMPNSYIREVNFRGKKRWFSITNTPLGNDRLVHTSEDVSARENALEQLKVSKELVQTVFDVTINPIAYHKAIRDKEGKIVDFQFQLENQRAREYSQGDRTGQRCSQAYPGIKDTVVFQKYCEVVETGNALDAEVEVNIKGSSRWFHLMAARLGDGLVASGIDITGRRQAQVEILRLKDEIAQHAEDKYRALFNAVDEGCLLAELVYDQHGRPKDILYLEGNPAASRLTGVADYKQKLLSQVAPEVEAYWLEIYHRVRSTGVPERLERYMAAQEHWYDFYISPLNESSDRVAVLFQDITERKENEKRQAYILNLTDALRPLADPFEIQQAAMKLLAEHLDVDRAGYYEMDEDQDNFTVTARYDRSAVPLPTSGRLSSFDPGLLSRYLSGQTITLNDSEEIETESLRAAYRAAGVRSWVVIPLVKEGRLLSAIGIQSSRPREWQNAALQMLADIAERTWLAVERAKAEQALRESEELRRIALESGAMGAWTWDTQKRVVQADRVVQALWGVSTDQQPHPVSLYTDMMYPESAAWLETGASKEISPGEAFHTHMQVARGSKSGRWIELRGQAELERPWIINGVSFDVTARKKVEEALRRSEEKYRTLFESIDEGFLIHEVIRDDSGKAIDLRLMEVNPAYIRQTGLSIDTVGKRATDFLPNLENFWIDTYDRVARSGNPERVESYNQATNRWYDVHISAVGGAGQQVAVLFEDITERKYERQRQEFLLKISDALALADSLKDVQTAVTDSLQAHFAAGWCYYVEWDEEKKTGLVRYDSKRDDLLSLAGIHDVSGIPEFFNHLKSGRILNVPNYRDYQLLSPKIRERYTAAGFRSMLVASLVRHDRLISSLIIGDNKIRDWSQADEILLAEVAERTWAAVERAKAEEALRESEKRLRSIANLVPDLLWDSEPDGSTNWYNDRWLQYTGQRLDEAIGWGWVDAIHPEDRESSAKRYAEAVEEGRPLRQEHRIRNFNGQYRWFVVDALPLKDEHGVVIKVYGTATDIHDRREAEQKILANQMRQSFLLELTDEVRPVSDPRKIQGIVARLLREKLDAGWCYYNNFDVAGTVSTVLIDNRRAGLPSMVGVHDFSENPEFISYLHGGNTFSTSDIANYPPFSENAIAHFTTAGMRAALGAPLIKDGRLVAVLLVADTFVREWTADETELLKEVAERTWSAIIRAQAEKSLQQVQANYLLRLEREVRERTNELEQSRDQLRSILDTTLVQMSILEAVRDEDGQITDFAIRAVNRELEKETGREDLVGKLYAQEYPGIKQTGLFDLIVEAIQTGEPRSTEYYYPHEDFHKWFTCMFVKFGDGVVATNMDISARKQAEEERFKNYLLLRQSEAIVLMGTWDFDLAKESFSWSEGMYRLFDLEIGTGVTPEIYLQHIARNSSAAASRMVAYIRKGNTDFEETLELKISGKTKILHIKAAVVYNSEGQPEKVLGVDLDITAMRQAEAKIKKMEQQQQLEIFRTSLSTLEEERHRISESLHNGIAQMLYAVKINMAGFTFGMGEKEFAENKTFMSKLLTDAINETRRISHELMPTTLEQFGLKSAIDDICTQLSNGTVFYCQISGQHRRLEKYMELAVYRTAQELMTNVVKHARATECKVQIHISSKHVDIQVEDNGRGLQLNKNVKPGIGLASIRSKIALLKGKVDIDAKQGRGTRISITIPRPQNHQNIKNL